MPDHNLLTFCAKARVLRDYFVAASVDEALAYLMSHHGDAQLVAGGTELMPVAQRGGIDATCLVDISRIGALRRAKLEEPYLVIGGAMTFAQMLSEPLIAAHAPLLFQAAQQMGTPSVRHLATLGGNLVSAQGSAQAAVVLVALDAQVEITNATGQQWLSASSIFVRPGLSRVDSTSEILTAVRFAPVAEGEGMALGTIAPSDDCYQAALVLVVILGLEPDGQTIAWASVAHGRVGHIPTRETGLEEHLAGADADSTETVGRLVSTLATVLAVDEATTALDATSVQALAQQLYGRALSMARGNADAEASSGG